MAKVKSYTGETQKEVLDKVRADLGRDAVIINTRRIRRRGLLGWLQKPLIEMIAVVDEIPSAALSGSSMDREKENFQMIVNETAKNEKLDRMEKQMSVIREMVGRVYRDVDTIKHKELTQYHPELQQIYDNLLAQDVLEENALRIIKEASVLVEKEQVPVKKAVTHILLKYLGEPSPITIEAPQEEEKKVEKMPLVEEAAPSGAKKPTRRRTSAKKKKKKHVITFVGPTGIGKTTSLAKIAANFALQNGVKVGFITEDTYRIGAVEQLRIYAEILEAPLGVIYSPQEVREAIDKMEDTDLILIDTAGKSPHDVDHREEINQLVEMSGADEVYLVISATTGYSGVVQILESYAFLKQYKLLFTKIDENGRWGNILNIRMLVDHPISYIATGQGVPEDIELANSIEIVNQFLGSVSE